VHIERQQVGGKILIDFFTSEDLRTILDLIKSNQIKSPAEMVDKYMTRNNGNQMEKKVLAENPELATYVRPTESVSEAVQTVEEIIQEEVSQTNEPSELDTEPELLDDRAPEEVKEAEEDVDLYNINKFSL
jgi:hypothetical protein